MRARVDDRAGGRPGGLDAAPPGGVEHESGDFPFSLSRRGKTSDFLEDALSSVDRGLDPLDFIWSFAATQCADDVLCADEPLGERRALEVLEEQKVHTVRK